MEIDKQNGQIAFNDKYHKYWNVNDESKKFISVTTLIERFAQPFDKDFWSAYKALEKLIPSESWKIEKKSLLNTKKFNNEILDLYNISINDFNREQQKVLDEWAESNREACERGTKIHAELENSFYSGGKNVKLDKFGIGGKFECRKNYTELDLPYGVYPEYLIYRTSDDGILNLAGQIDCLVKNGNDIWVIDHKSNRKIDLKSGFNTQSKASIKMKYPLNNLDDCNYNHYQLQLSTYAWMLQKLNPKFVIKDLILNHYDHEGKNTMYHCDYLKKEVERMLAQYKKDLILEQQRARRKPIEY
jgi:hypothetical protein